MSVEAYYRAVALHDGEAAKKIQEDLYLEFTGIVSGISRLNDCASAEPVITSSLLELTHAVAGGYMDQHENQSMWIMLQKAINDLIARS